MDLKSKFRWDRATPMRVAGVAIVILSMFLNVFSAPIPIRGHDFAHLALDYCFAVPRDLIRDQGFAHSPFTTWLVVFLSVLLGASGLINPLLLLYLFLKPTRRIRVLVIFGILLADAACLMALLLAVLGILPGIGFYLWVAGTILILAPPYRSGKQAPPPSLSKGFEDPASRA